jgi:hypothetical protein
MHKAPKVSPKKKARTVRAGNADTEAMQLLGPIVGFLRRSGIPDAELIDAFQLALETEIAAPKRFDVTRIGDRHTPEQVVDRWARQAEYTNAAGKPLAIPFAGTVSVTTLVNEVNRVAQPRRVLRELIKYGNVKRQNDGRYRLIGRFANFKIPRSLPFEPNFQFLVDAISSATRGIGSNTASRQLFWIQHSIKLVPTRFVPEFLGFIKTRGTVFASEANDWLDQHAVSATVGDRRNRKTCRLGIGLFPIYQKE